MRGRMRGRVWAEIRSPQSSQLCERGSFLLDEFVLRLVHGLGDGRFRGELLLLER